MVSSPFDATELTDATTSISSDLEDAKTTLLLMVHRSPSRTHDKKSMSEMATVTTLVWQWRHAEHPAALSIIWSAYREKERSKVRILVTEDGSHNIG
mmetsp:Transcript_21066/g.47773  ORF Transcript_21066/g.47773 Transcript_21066/m.47773 type:complete len:97 (+) Transcript_21066:442-732(+)